MDPVWPITRQDDEMRKSDGGGKPDVLMVQCHGARLIRRALFFCVQHIKHSDLEAFHLKTR